MVDVVKCFVCDGAGCNSCSGTGIKLVPTLAEAERLKSGSSIPVVMEFMCPADAQRVKSSLEKRELDVSVKGLP